MWSCVGKMKKSSVERLPEVLNYIKRHKSSCPNQISKKINMDKRTVNKCLNTLVKLKLIKINKLKLGKRIYQEIKLK